MISSRTRSISPTFLKALIGSSIVHLGLIAYGTYQDAHSSVKYTDVDYVVFSDAARMMWTGPGVGSEIAGQDKDGSSQGLWGGSWLGSPYTRSTYRYTPLLAVLMLPNYLVHPAFGKIVFSACDVLIGYLLYLLFPPSCSVQTWSSTPANDERHRNESTILTTDETNSSSGQTGIINNNKKSANSPRKGFSSNLESSTIWISALWLFNPVPLNISTRGSSESLLGALILTSLYLFESSPNLFSASSLTRSQAWASVALGLAVHLKIYPVLYAFAVLGFLGRNERTILGRLGVCRGGIEFGVISAGTFGFVTLGCWLIWGYPAIYHPYLYHLTRLDHRHNFSPYFYPIYLLSSTNLSFSSNPSALIKLLRSSLTSFVPQLGLSFGLSWWLGSRGEMALAWGLGTMAFVCFNKVITSQYFICWILGELVSDYR
ncbi:Mannosyltransferase [Phaffia rhodozyma]|uniref:GPI mannosyltransferase 1 n=1 Tax=Phaffia rhodozyma TaxID=264483 RepID=A0A0F7SIM5_PHARH|nr:Mannosyltransferase [Phaffia rhodozyma]